MRKILIVGGSSLLGSYFFEYMKSKDVGASRTFSSRNKNYKLESDVIYDLGQKKPFLIPENCSHAYIFAGITSIEECEKNPSAAFNANVEGTKQLIIDLDKHGCKPIFISSEAIFGNHSKPSNVFDAAKPLNNYGRYKLEIENFLNLNIPNNGILRLSKVCSYRSKFAREWQNSLQRKQVINAYANKFIAPVFPFQVNFLLEKFYRNELSGTHHLSNKNEFSYHSLALSLVDRWKIGPELINKSFFEDPQAKFTDKLTNTFLSSEIPAPQNNLESITEGFFENHII